jgi:hypothetical protein
MFGRNHGAATSRTGLQRLGQDAPRHSSRDKDSAESVLKRTLRPSIVPQPWPSGRLLSKGRATMPRRDVPSCDRGYISLSVRYTFGHLASSNEGKFY